MEERLDLLKLKGSILAMASAGVVSAVILAGLAVNVASGAPTDVPTSPTATTGNPPAAPVEPPSTAPTTGTNPGGNELGVNNAPTTTGNPAGASNLPSAGFGPNAGSSNEGGSLALFVVGLAGFALVTAGAATAKKRSK